MKYIHLCYINIDTFFWFLFHFLPMFMLHKEFIKPDTVMALLALICSRFLNLFSDYNMFNCCFNGKEEFCGCEQRNMKGIVAFLWEEYENIHWQRSYGEQLSQFDNAVRFSTFMSTAGHVVPGWEIPQWLEAECIGCWPGWQCWKSGVGSGKKRKMTFYGLETVREKKKKPKPPVWNVRKESLKDAPSQTAVPQRLSLILRFRFLKYLY